MTVPYFLDTNVLIYAAMGRDKEEAKRRRALELITADNFGTSAQVAQEFYVTMKRLSGPAFKPRTALEWLDRLQKLSVVATDFDLVIAAVSLSERYRTSYWDGAILAAAERLMAPILYTEDLSHGQVYGSVRVENPFRDL